MHLEREAVHQARKLDVLVVEAADEFVELLLRRHHDPVLAAPLDAELLDDRLEVEHLLDVAGDELPDFVDDEHQGLAGLPPLHQQDDPVGQLARADVGAVDVRLGPGVGHRERVGVHLVERPARLAEGEHGPGLADVPLALGLRLVDLLEPFKLALLLQVDFEFGEVEVVGIAEARQEEPVHDLAEHLVA